MIRYEFHIEGVEPLKGSKITGAKDYQTKVIVYRDETVIYEDTIKVRKNKEGIFPDPAALEDRRLSRSLRKDLSKNLKEYIKKAR